jgi:hypothetical protein
MAVQTEYPGAFAALRMRVEMGDLAQRVHARVGAAATADANFVIGDFRQCVFDAALHGRFLTLQLPAEENAPVVFESQRKPHQQAASKSGIFVWRAMDCKPANKRGRDDWPSRPRH